LTIEKAIEEFPREAGITRYGEPEKIATIRMDGGEVKSI